MEQLGEVEAGRMAPSVERAAAEPGDRALLRRVRAGSGEAAEALVRRHWAGAHRIGFTRKMGAGEFDITAEDAEGRPVARKSLEAQEFPLITPARVAELSHP